MKFKKLLFIFIITLLSSITMVGCSEDDTQSQGQAAKDTAHGHSH